MWSLFVLGVVAGCSGCRKAPSCGDSGCVDESTVDSPPDSPTHTAETGTETGTETGETGDPSPKPCGDYAVSVTGDRPSNLLMISVDTLRRDRIGAFGYDTRPTTPTIDRFFEEGLAFGQHHSCSSWTFPSVLCALTGRSLFDLELWPEKGDALPPPAPEGIVLLSEILADAGYWTMLSGGSGFLGAASNMDQGFAAGESFFYDKDKRYPDHDYLDNDEVIALGLQLLDKRPDEEQPFYLQIHLQQVHAPYIATNEWLAPMEYFSLLPCKSDKHERIYDLGTKEDTVQVWKDFPGLTANEQNNCLEHLSIRYDAALAQTDDHIADLLAELDKRGVLDDTLVLFLSDHGEELYEHGNFDHGKSAFEEAIRVGAALWYPPSLDPSSVCDPTTHEDLVPTVLDVMGLPSKVPFTGRVPDPDNPRSVVHNLTMMSEGRSRQAVSDGKHKLIVRWDCDDNDGGPWWLFDLEEDPGEQDNLYGDPAYEAVAKELWAQLEPQVTWVDDRDEQSFVCPWSW